MGNDNNTLKTFNLQIALSPKQIQTVKRFRETMGTPDAVPFEVSLMTMLHCGIREEQRDQEQPETMRIREAIRRRDAERRAQNEQEGNNIEITRPLTPIVFVSSRKKEQ